MLNLLKDRITFLYLKFESLDDEGQDLSLQLKENEAELIQVKKRGEAYLWTPASIKPIFEKLITSSHANDTYVFFTDGSLNKELIDLRRALDAKGKGRPKISEATLSSIGGLEIARDDLLSFMSRCRLLTRQFVSPNADDPALGIRRECQLILSNSPFTPLLDVEQAYRSLWELAFEKSRVNGQISYEELHAHAKAAGLIRVYNGFPILAAEDCRRTDETSTIVRLHDSSTVLFVYGLSGTGKSTLVARSLQELEYLGKLLWFSTSPSYDGRYFRQILTIFLEAAKYSSQTQSLRNDRVSDDDAVINALAKTDVTIVFDATEKASASLNFLWEKILSSTRTINKTSKLVFIGQELPRWFRGAYGSRVSTFQLKGFTYSDFISYLGNVPELDANELIRFYDQTGGLPIAASLLKATLASQAAYLDASKIVEESSDAIHRALFSQVISGLDEVEREFVEAASVFEGEFTIDEVNLLLERPLKSAAKVLELIPKCVVNEFEGATQLHDSIRPLAYGLLLKKTAARYHKKLAAHYAMLMEERGHLFELIHKWAHQVKKCESLQSPYMKAICSLDEYEVFSLWAIYTAGFPFAFSEDDFSGRLDCINNLIEKDLVQVDANYDPERRTFGVAERKRLFRLKGADPWDTGFLWHVAQRLTPANHMGYIDVNEPNYAWQLQAHTICPWEHRIEFELLIPHDGTASEVRERFAKEVEAGELSWRGSEANGETLAELDRLVLLQDVAPGDSRLDEAVGSCPVFGHCCPGGSAQANLCRVEDEEEKPAAENA